MFEDLKKKTVITEKEKNYFKFNFKKATNAGKLYLQPKIHKRLSNVPRRPVISNCVTTTEKVSKLLRSSFAASNERRKVVHKRYS